MSELDIDDEYAKRFMKARNRRLRDFMALREPKTSLQYGAYFNAAVTFVVMSHFAKTGVAAGCEAIDTIANEIRQLLNSHTEDQSDEPST